MNYEKIEFIVSEDDGYRLDYYLSLEMNELSRTYAQKLIKEKAVTVNGEHKTVDSNKSDNIGGTGGITGIYSRNNNNQPPTSYTVKSTDTGKLFCQAAYVTYNKDTSLGGKRTLADWRCAYVPYNYELTPCIVSGSYACGGVDVPKEPGESITLVPTVKNTTSTKTKESDWKITSWEVSGSDENIKTPSNSTDNTSSDTCATYNSLYSGKTVGCESYHTGKSTFSEAETILSSVINKFTVPANAELGSRYCFALSINNYKYSNNEDQGAQTNKSNQWRHGAPLCIMVTKKPKMQIWGSGVWTNGGIQASVSKKGSTTFGSWVEYEIISSKTVTGIASASGYNNGNSSTALNDIAKLTTRTSSAMGGYTGNTWAGSSQSIISNLKSRYESTATSGWNPSSVSANGSISAFKTNSLSLGGFTLNNGQSAILFVSGDVTINNNIIANTAGATSAGNLPQMIIIATGSINIQNNVNQIDAWLLASGDLKTCNVAKTSVNQTSCGNSLRINGPVVANNIKSWRTAGALPNSSESAETYNLRADTYLWTHSKSSGNGKIITTYTSELPVRF